MGFVEFSLEHVFENIYHGRRFRYSNEIMYLTYISHGTESIPSRVNRSTRLPREEDVRFDIDINPTRFQIMEYSHWCAE